MGQVFDMQSAFLFRGPWAHHPITSNVRWHHTFELDELPGLFHNSSASMFILYGLFSLLVYVTCDFWSAVLQLTFNAFLFLLHHTGLVVSRQHRVVNSLKAWDEGAWRALIISFTQSRITWEKPLSGGLCRWSCHMSMDVRYYLCYIIEAKKTFSLWGTPLLGRGSWTV